MLLLKKFISDYFITNDERIKKSYLYTPVYANNSIFCKKPGCDLSLMASILSVMLNSPCYP